MNGVFGVQFIFFFVHLKIFLVEYIQFFELNLIKLVTFLKIKLAITSISTRNLKKRSDVVFNGSILFVIDYICVFSHVLFTQSAGFEPARGDLNRFRVSTDFESVALATTTLENVQLWYDKLALKEG